MHAKDIKKIENLGWKYSGTIATMDYLDVSMFEQLWGCGRKIEEMYKDIHLFTGPCRIYFSTAITYFQGEIKTFVALKESLSDGRWFFFGRISKTMKLTDILKEYNLIDND